MTKKTKAPNRFEKYVKTKRAAEALQIELAEAIARDGLSEEERRHLESLQPFFIDSQRETPKKTT